MQDYSDRGVLCPKEEANTCCWGVEKPKGELKRMYFKLPALKDEEVRLKVLHVGLCHSDCYKVDEGWGPGVAYPLVPGHEIVAEVERVGAKVKDHKPGDTVAVGVLRDCCGGCEMCRKGNDQLCTKSPYRPTYDPYLGGYSTHMQLRGDFVFPLPKALPPSKASPILCAGVTVWSPLKRWGKPGMRCGVMGVGGLGHMAIQFASKMGMHVVAISTSADKEREAAAFGAREFVCTKSPEQVKRLVDGDKLDLVINTALMYDITNYLAAVKPAGVFVQLGAPNNDKSLIFNNLDLVCNQKILTGSLVGSRAEVVGTLDFCSEFGVVPVVENFSWADLPKAYHKLHDGVPKYRCVVDVASTYDGL